MIQGKNAFSITPPSYFLHINESLCFIDALRSNSPTSRKGCVDTMCNKFNILIKGLANHYFAILNGITNVIVNCLDNSMLKGRVIH